MSNRNQSKINNYSDNDDDELIYNVEGHNDNKINREVSDDEERVQEDTCEIDYYPELKEHRKFIEKHPECEYEYGLLCDDTLHLFKTHHDFFDFEKCNNIIINNYKFYIMEEVKDNIKPDDY